MMTSKQIVVRTVTTLALISAAIRVEGAEHVIWQPVRGVRELFLDDVGVERVSNLQRVVHQPERRANPVLSPDMPWESRCQVYGTAMFDDDAGKFKIWYLTTAPDRGNRPLKLATHERAPHTTLAAYAESTDGVTWVKPKLGVFPYDGDTANNLLDLGRFNCEGVSVLLDRHDPNPQRRWKAAFWDHGSGGWEMRNGQPYAKPGPNDGFCVACSPDGIHWKPYEANPVLAKYCDTNQNLVYDPRLKKYVAYSRFGFGRKLARSESDDFEHWSEPILVLACDDKDGPSAQIYGAGVDLYEGLYVAMVWVYHEGTNGTIDTQLATSRDGVNWTRVGDRAVWLPLGHEDSWEGGMMRSVERIIVRGDRLSVYYCGVHGPHAGPKIKNVVRKYPTAIGLATLRRDGFASYSADEKTGTLLTKPFRLPEGTLHLNFDATKGSVRVSLCNEVGEQIEGTESTLNGDQTAAKFGWHSAQIEQLGGQPVRLRFELVSAALYSYWWE